MNRALERAGRTRTGNPPQPSPRPGGWLFAAAWLVVGAAVPRADAQDMSDCVWAQVTADDQREIFNRCAGEPITLFWCVAAPGDSCASYTHRRNDFASGARQPVERHGALHYGACNGPAAAVRSHGLDFECPAPALSTADDDPGAGPSAAGAGDLGPADGATGAARLLACPSTGERYPPASMRLGEQGTVEVRAAVGADGRVSDAQLLASSGYPRLDAATLALLQDCTFAAATGEAGQPVDGVVLLRLRWALEP